MKMSFFLNERERERQLLDGLNWLRRESLFFFTIFCRSMNARLRFFSNCKYGLSRIINAFFFFFVIDTIIVR